MNVGESESTNMYEDEKENGWKSEWKKEELEKSEQIKEWINKWTRD